MTKGMTTGLFAAAAMVACAGAANADVWLNEIYASHAGTDDMEFIELLGTPGMSLDGWALLIVEGDDPNSGTVDRIWALDGFSIPADGYFVLGDDAVPNLDFSIGATNRIENGTETFVLIDYTSLPALGDDLDTDNDGIMETPFSTFGAVGDRIGIIDAGVTDFTYGGADTRGPDGTFLPAGIYRPNDFPADWAFDFLNFDDTATDGNVPTPGTRNIPTPGALALAGIAGLLGVRRRRA